MRVAAIQMCSGAKIHENLYQAEALIQEAHKLGVKLVVLPEMFSCMGTDETFSPGFPYKEIINFLSEQAKKCGMWIVGGTIPIFSGTVINKAYAACLIFDANGKQAARYDKMHLFDADLTDKHSSYRESNTTCPGNNVVVTNSPIGNIGCAVCYDLRFPELFRLMFNLGANVFVLPSAFTAHTGTAHWLPLIQARAIENQCYFIAANQAGKQYKTREMHGHSVIVDAWGKVIVAAEGYTQGIITADINIQELNNIRSQMPIAKHQRIYNTKGDQIISR